MRGFPLFSLMLFVAFLAPGPARAEVIEASEGIYLATGFGNTFLVVTSEGGVIIDTSGRRDGRRHYRELRSAYSGPIKYVILTHGHGDHTGGLEAWLDGGAKLVAHESYYEFLTYQERLRAFFRRRNAAQYQGKEISPPAGYAVPKPSGEPDIPVAKSLTLKLGGLSFQIMHTPGETPDHLSAYIPEKRAAFIGDNYYRSFPNIYTLRGTRPRWALDYINSLDTVLALRPEVLLPSHGLPITGQEEIKKTLTQYRDAVAYVHDAVVRGMNEGKDVFTLMEEIKLPEALDVGEGYGRVSWSVRGIYEGYAGWFDMNPASMYAAPERAAYAELAALAGGAGPVVKRAAQLAAQGHAALGLRLIDAALAADPGNQEALKLQIRVYEDFLAQANNSIEKGWLKYGLNKAKEALGQ